MNFFKEGITGTNCEGNGGGQVSSLPCNNNQCKNGASCYETSSTTYGCACLGGYYGKQFLLKF